MILKNFIIGGISKDDATDRLIYYAKDLDSQPLMEFEIKETAKKYPSNFLYGILMDNGHMPFLKDERYKFDEDFINSFCPMIFSTIVDDGGKFQKKKKDYIYVHDLIVIPNMAIRQNTQIIRELKRYNDGNGY